MRIPHKISAVVCVLALTTSVLASVVAPVRADSGQLPIAIQIEGRGYGHGRGMSQYGSYGYATVYGWSWDAILNFYYGGATGNTLGSLADPGQEMTTWLSAMNNAQTAVITDSSNALFLQDPVPGRTWTSLVAREIANRVYRVWGTQERRCASSGVDPAAEGFVLIGDVQEVASFTTTVGADPAAAPEQLIGLCEPRPGTTRFKIRYYRGEIRAVNNSRGENRTINATSIESYLRGVVPRESPAEWGAAAGGA